MRSAALLLRRTPIREADLVLELLSSALGRVSVVARGARKSQRRFGGALEPVHELMVEMEERGEGLGVLVAAEIARPRFGVIEQLGALTAAGRALAWVREVAPPRVPEDAIWSACQELLDALDRGVAGTALEREAATQVALASFGMQLIEALGWGLTLDECVACRRPCPEGQAAFVSARRGGAVCRACGGAGLVIGGATRARLLGLSAGGALAAEDAEPAIALVEETLRVHAGLSG
ncbi:MAG: DNA repair protein RecO [Polyangiaceae bacterium]|nr:DNA repair protein RecO [Polyangiaceae bacterium]